MVGEGLNGSGIGHAGPGWVYCMLCTRFLFPLSRENPPVRTPQRGDGCGARVEGRKKTRGGLISGASLTGGQGTQNGRNLSGLCGSTWCRGGGPILCQTVGSVTGRRWKVTSTPSSQAMA